MVTEEDTYRGNILIDESGSILAITPTEEEPGAAEIIDATGLHVFPGVIDPHSHLNDPGYTESEDFYTGTCGAAAGGITTVLEHPLTNPLTADLGSFLDKLAIARAKAVVDFALWGALTPENVAGSRTDELRQMAEAGVIAFKAFMPYSPEIPRLPDGLLLEGLRRSADLGVPVGIHCENQDLIDFLTVKLQSEGRRDALVHAQSRPPVTEVEAVRRALTLAEEAGARIHLVHLSHPRSFQAVAEARDRGMSVTAETCPHYLTLTVDDLARLGPYAKCSPPLREASARDRLWEQLTGGYVDCIGSDHAAYTREEKERPDFWDVPAGITGIQTMFPLIVGEAARRGVPLSLLAGLFSANVARIFGLYPRKGSLRPGSDADLTLVELESPWVVRASDLFSKSGWTPYEGMTVRVRVRRTMVRGRTVYLDVGGRSDGERDGAAGRITVDAGYGQFVRPTRSDRGSNRGNGNKTQTATPNGISVRWKGFWQAVSERRSIRSFLNTPVPRRQIELLLDAARLAPSAGNTQPWHFYVVTDAEQRRRLVEATYPGSDCTSPRTQSWMLQAPVILVACLDWPRGAAKYNWEARYFLSLQDLAAAIENLLLAAEALGLGACWVEGIRFLQVAQALGIPPTREPVALIPVGYPRVRPGTRRVRPLEEVRTWL